MKFITRLSVGVCLLLYSGTVTALALGEPHPNIVLIISDDQGWTDYGFMGHPEICTPHLDELARQSVLFTRGYVPTALCRPSLMTLVTGHYAHRHGITGNDPSPKYARAGTPEHDKQRARLIAHIDKLPTLPGILADRGYVSFQSGKWWEGGYRRGGFTEGMTRGFPNRGGRHGDQGLSIGREGLEPIREFIDSTLDEKEPFFVWYAPFLPHTPHNPPQRILDKYSKEGRSNFVSRYYAMCQWFDETCGELIEYLEEKRIRDNTLIVYVTDNGWIQNPKGRKFARRSKQSPYEGGIRTPIMLSWPSRLTAQKREDLVSSIDLVPTMLAAAGASIPSELPGLNLLPSVRDARPIDRRTIFGESFAHDIADIHDPEASLLFRWCIDGQWKLLLTYDGETNRYASIHPREEKRPQLYDLLNDPFERTNVAGRHPSIVARLVKKINAWYPVTTRKVVTAY